MDAEAFGYHDRDADGLLALNEVFLAARSLGLTPDKLELERLFAGAKPRRASTSAHPGEEALDRTQFGILLARLRQIQPSVVGDAKVALEAFSDQDGLIDAGELRHALGVMGQQMSAQELDECLAQLPEQKGKLKAADVLGYVAGEERPADVDDA